MNTGAGLVPLSHAAVADPKPAEIPADRDGRGSRAIEAIALAAAERQRQRITMIRIFRLQRKRQGLISHLSS